MTTTVSITNKFDSTCAACKETVWAGEKAVFNPHAQPGNKVKHERCVTTPLAPTKHCSKCGTDKPLAAFNKNKAAKDGKSHWCKPCNAEYMKEYNKNYTGPKQVEPAPVEGYDLTQVTQYVSNSLGLSKEALSTMKYGDVMEFMELQKRLDNLRNGVKA